MKVFKAGFTYTQLRQIRILQMKLLSGLTCTFSQKNINCGNYGS